MKKYTKPAMEIVSLQSKENIAAESPLNAAIATTSGGVVTTVYNLAIMNNNSLAS